MSTIIQQRLPAGTWKLDPVHSSATFEVKHMVVATYRSRFDRFDASLAVGDDGSAELSGTVDVDSIEAKDENLAAHLASPEFFDAANHPRISFRSTELSVGADGALTLSGVLRIKDHEAPLQATGSFVGPHADIAGNEKVGLALEAVVDRTLYGLNWNAPLPKGGFALGNDVKLRVELELVRGS